MVLKQNKWTLVLILFLVVTIITLAALLLIPEKETKPLGQGVLFQPIEEVLAGSSLPDISIPGRTVLVLPSGVKEADVSFHNPVENADNYNLSFAVKIKETGEILFETGQIEPGYECRKVTLSRELEVGEYDIIIAVQPYLRSDENTRTNNAELDARLIVE